MTKTLPSAIKERIEAKYQRNELIASLKEQLIMARDDVSEYEKNGFKWASDQARARMADITNHLMDMGAIK